MEHRKCIEASSREITINQLCEISTTIPNSYSASQKKKFTFNHDKNVHR